jgi:hypothetical protein
LRSISNDSLPGSSFLPPGSKKQQLFDTSSPLQHHIHIVEAHPLVCQLAQCRLQNEPAAARKERGSLPCVICDIFRPLAHPHASQEAMKYVLVTGGVVSGLGKGVTASSVGVLLKNCGLRVTSIKIGEHFVLQKQPVTRWRAHADPIARLGSRRPLS